MPESDLDALQAWLDTLPAPLEPLDVVMLDGYLCGIVVQPDPPPEARWLAHVFDINGRAAPPELAQAAGCAAIRARYRSLKRAIDDRKWFDPWIYRLDDDASIGDTVLPWVAGFATALETFPLPAAKAADPSLIEPMALLYCHFDPQDLEDADDLLAEIDALEPLSSLDEAVESLVRATLLIADVTRPRATGPTHRAGARAYGRTPARGTKAR